MPFNTTRPGYGSMLSNHFEDMDIAVQRVHKFISVVQVVINESLNIDFDSYYLLDSALLLMNFQVFKFYFHLVNVLVFLCLVLFGVLC